MISEVRIKTGLALSILVIALFSTSIANAIGISFTDSSGEVLEDTILFTSVNGAAPRDGVALGDFDLSLATGFVVDVDVDPTTTHWWLIGHQAGDVVFSSNVDLLGVEMYGAEPYLAGDELAWNIAGNLDGYVNGTGFSIDWWARTITNHSAHVTEDGSAADLWKFSSPGHDFGSLAINMHNNVIPGSPPPGGNVPEPATLALMGLGVVSLIGLRRRNLKQER